MKQGTGDPADVGSPAAHLVDLPLPLAAPEPAPDCDVCAALARQRVEAQALGDYSQVTDCNVEIQSHPHPKRRGGVS